MSDKQNTGGLCRVGCHAANCIYHGAGDCCKADAIHVGSASAVRKGETYCETFRAGTTAEF